MRGAKPKYSDAAPAACTPPHRLALLGTSPRWGEEGASRTRSVPPYAYAVCRIARLPFGETAAPSDLPPCGGDARQGRGGCSEANQSLGKNRQEKPPPIFPAPSLHAYNSPVPHRIHRKAFRRGGAGAGVEGKTQSLIVRVRGKWSPSGDTGRGDGQRTGPSSLDARKSAPGVPVRHTGWPNGWFRRTFLSVRVKRRVRRRRHGSLAITRFARGPCGILGFNPRRTPSGKAKAEGPKSRIKTAERGAERCHLLN